MINVVLLIMWICVILYNRIIALYQENKCPTIAHNVGLDYVFEKRNAEWIAFVDNDDCIHGDYL